MIEDASNEYGISNPKAVTKGKKKFVNTFVVRPNYYIDKEKVALIKKELPPQPWPRGTHQHVADKLGLHHSEVTAAISYLIQNGDFYIQMNGVLYDEEGNVVK